MKLTDERWEIKQWNSELNVDYKPVRIMPMRLFTGSDAAALELANHIVELHNRSIESELAQASEPVAFPKGSIFVTDIGQAWDAENNPNLASTCELFVPATPQPAPCPRCAELESDNKRLVDLYADTADERSTLQARYAELQDQLNKCAQYGDQQAKLTAAELRIQLLELDMESGTYETLYAQVVEELGAEKLGRLTAESLLDECKKGLEVIRTALINPTNVPCVIAGKGAVKELLAKLKNRGGA